MQIGILAPLRKDREGDIFEPVLKHGLTTCQLVSWDPEIWDDDLARKVTDQSGATGVSVCAFWSGVPGPAKWNFTQGPVTLGLVPRKYRQQRISTLKKGAEFAEKIHTKAVITHCGFIPENITDPEYDGVVSAISDVAEYCKSLGLEFWFETGQETPVVLLRTIERVGMDNLGINLDPANLIMYGKGNPIDALDVFGKYVRNVHVKDGMYPTDGDQLGREVQVGQGQVRFPQFIERLKEIGFDGELVIEREIKEGQRKNRDITETIENLRRWIA